jgi:thymidylate kinase
MLLVNSAQALPKLSSELFESLNQSGIGYCHWKSNESLSKGLVGETDLDILVQRSAFGATCELLLKLGFKQAIVRGGIPTPAVLHFYGYDEDAAQLLHVHLYSRLLTGESTVKSHAVPCEPILLSEGSQIGDVHVPADEAEAAVTVLRTFIKRGSLMHLLFHGERNNPGAQADLFLDNANAADESYEALIKCCRAVDRDLFVACYRALAQGASPLNLWWLGVQLRRQVRGYERYSFVGRMRAYGQAALGKLKRLPGKSKNKVLQSGGAVVAFIGGDATGKSTLVTESARWLGRTFAVRTFHLGKPPHTCLTFPLWLVLPIARRLFPDQRHAARRIVGVAGNENEPQQNSAPPGGASIIYAIRALGLAWDRSVHVCRAQRAAAEGDIVFCDRYPSDEWGATDGPRLQFRASDNSWRSRFMNWLARCEHRLYRQNPPPDVALRLKVSLATAKRRNRQRTSIDRHTDEDLAARHEPTYAWKKTGTKVVHDIDTELDLAETLTLVRKTLWELL